MEEKKEKKKLNLKERWKDKRERAKIELMLYGIFFLVIIIFARISSSMSTNIPKDNDINNTFIDGLRIKQCAFLFLLYCIKKINDSSLLWINGHACNSKHII